jgi:hypothetical protein
MTALLGGALLEEEERLTLRLHGRHNWSQHHTCLPPRSAGSRVQGVVGAGCGFTGPG